MAALQQSIHAAAFMRVRLTVHLGTVLVHEKYLYKHVQLVMARWLHSSVSSYIAKGLWAYRSKLSKVLKGLLG